MEEGELYAIETFGSTGKGVVHEDLECRSPPPLAALRFPHAGGDSRRSRVQVRGVRRGR